MRLESLFEDGFLRFFYPYHFHPPYHESYYMVDRNDTDRIWGRPFLDIVDGCIFLWYGGWK